LVLAVLKAMELILIQTDRKVGLGEQQTLEPFFTHMAAGVVLEANLAEPFKLAVVVVRYQEAITRMGRTRIRVLMHTVNLEALMHQQVLMDMPQALVELPEALLYLTI